MNVPQTSIDVYRKVLESGLIGEQQKKAYAWIYENQSLPKYGGAVSQYDIAEAIPGAKERQYGRRFAELVRMGVLAEVGKKKNRLGNDVTAYRTTNSLPVADGGGQTGRKMASVVKILEAAQTAAIAAGLDMRGPLHLLIAEAKLRKGGWPGRIPDQYKPAEPKPAKPAAQKNLFG